MRKLILRISLSLDGCMEAATGKLDFAKARSPEGMAWVGEKMAQAGAHLLGRKAFCEMAGLWPTAPGPLAQTMNEVPKIVFTRTGFDPAQATSAKGWADATVCTGDLSAAITQLKQQPGKDLMAHGGLSFAQSLVATGLIDEYCLALHPVVAGPGLRLFDQLPQPLPLTLAESRTFSTGAMGVVYRAQQ